MASATNKNFVSGVNFVLLAVSLVLLFGVTWCIEQPADETTRPIERNTEEPNKRDVIVYADDIGSIHDSGINNKTAIQGPKGDRGQKGIKGDKGEVISGGTVYVRWGHDQCPSTAKLVYSGRVGGSYTTQSGGGSNPQCLPLDPNFLSAVSGSSSYRAYMYGAEYYTYTSSSDGSLNGRQNYDVPCAVCYVTNRTAVYMIPAKYICPSGWTREYYGYLMAERYTSAYRSEFTCMDIALKPVGSSRNNAGLVFYFVEGACGSLPCSPYIAGRELSCAVCTK